jgi:hypothetical protein
MPGYRSFTAFAKGKTKPPKAIYTTPLNAISSEEH